MSLPIFSAFSSGTVPARGLSLLPKGDSPRSGTVPYPYGKRAWAALLLPLAACAPDASDPVAAAAPENRIECALDGATAFATACALERGAGELIVRHANGGFRRFLLAADLGVSPADGAEPIAGEPLPDGRFELRIADDRYRLPAP